MFSRSPCSHRGPPDVLGRRLGLLVSRQPLGVPTAPATCGPQDRAASAAQDSTETKALPLLGTLDGKCPGDARVSVNQIGVARVDGGRRAKHPRWQLVPRSVRQVLLLFRRVGLMLQRTDASRAGGTDCSSAGHCTATTKVPAADCPNLHNHRVARERSSEAHSLPAELHQVNKTRQKCKPPPRTQQPPPHSPEHRRTLTASASGPPRGVAQVHTCTHMRFHPFRRCSPRSRGFGRPRRRAGRRP